MKRIQLISQLLPLIPQHLHATLVSQPSRIATWENSQDATLLFADVSGFTALSEALLKTGQDGAEYLTQILNQYFFTMLNTINQYQGSIAKFGGDALTIIFPELEKQSQVLSAIHCANHMMQNMGLLTQINTPAGTFELHMKCGMSYGPIYETFVGSPETQLEYILAGKPLDQAAEAEHIAQLGQIIMHHSFYSQVEDMVAGVPHSTDFFIFQQTHKFPQLLPALPIDLFSHSSKTSDQLLHYLQAFIHPFLYDHLKSGSLFFSGEHRHIAVAFLSFEGISYAKKEMEFFYSQLFQIIQKYNGYINKLDMGDKGAKALLLFGAPKSDGKEKSHAIQACYELIHTKNTPAHLKIGLTYGRAYCGWIGSDKRKEFTAMGDTVNTAARLMMCAEPKTLVLPEVLAKQLEYMGTYRRLAPIQLKGKSSPIPIVEWVDLDENILASNQNLFVGRQEELDRIQRILHRASLKQGQIISVIGEAGIGKTCLIQEVIPMAKALGFGDYYGSFDQQDILFQPIQQMIHHEAEIVSHQPKKERRQRYKQYFESMLPHLAPFIPIYVHYLSDDYPHNSFTKGLPNESRLQAFFHGVTQWMYALSALHPVLMIWEDLHYADASIPSLLEILGTAIQDMPIALILSYRPGTRLDALDPLNNHHTIGLDSLSVTEQLELWKSYTHTSVDEVFLERTNGNPLYLAELAKHVANRGNLEAIPDSLQSLITARLDSMHGTTEQVIKIASVIGNEFDLDTLLSIYPTEIDSDRLIESLAEAEKHQIINRINPDQTIYRYRHDILRDIAYHLLSEHVRTTLHHALGNFYSKYGDNGHHWKKAAWHYKKAHAMHYAKSWFKQSADWFYDRRESDYLEAYIQYASCLDLDFIQVNQVHSEEEMEVMYRIGKGYMDTYQWGKAITLLSRLKRIADEHFQTKYLAASLNRLAECYWHTDRLTDAEIATNQALRIKDSITQANAHHNLGKLQLRKSKYQEALKAFETCLIAFRNSGDKNGEASSLYYVGLIYFTLGNYAHAITFYEQSLDLYKTMEHKSGEALSLGTIGSIYQRLRDYKKALQYHQKSHALSSAIQDHDGMARALSRMGALHGIMGNFSRAWEYQDQALQLKQKIDDKQGQALSLRLMGELCYEQGDYEEAEALQKQSVNICKSINHAEGLASSLIYLGMIYLSRNEYDQAQTTLYQGYEILRTIGNKPLEAKASFIIGKTYLRKDQPGKTETYWRSAYLGLQEIPNPSLALELHTFSLGYYAFFQRSFYKEVTVDMLRQELSAIQPKQASSKEQLLLHLGNDFIHSITTQSPIPDKQWDRLINTAKQKHWLALIEEFQWWQTQFAGGSLGI